MTSTRNWTKSDYTNPKDEASKVWWTCSDKSVRRLQVVSEWPKIHINRGAYRLLSWFSSGTSLSLGRFLTELFRSPSYRLVRPWTRVCHWYRESPFHDDGTKAAVPHQTINVSKDTIPLGPFLENSGSLNDLTHLSTAICKIGRIFNVRNLLVVSGSVASFWGPFRPLFWPIFGRESLNWERTSHFKC